MSAVIRRASALILTGMSMVLGMSARAAGPEPSLPAQPFDYVGYAETQLPAHFRQDTPGGSVISTDNTPIDNPLTNAGATLGRVLFYDNRLSANDSTSCASCHEQEHGFDDSLQRSVGFEGALTNRNSTGLGNARFYARGHFRWDETANQLEDQALLPIQDGNEMGLTLPQLVSKVSAEGFYPPLFQAAFGTPEINADRIAMALSQFVRSMVSYSSKFDQAFAGGGPPNFQGTLTAQEYLGLQLFQPVPGATVASVGCAACHGTVAQITANVHNIGLDAADTDNGAGNGRFKAQSLRNIAVRAPYMHDGRFDTLAQVVEFYNSGVQNNPNLDPRLRAGPGGPPQRLNLTANEKAALVAFLNTLTDQQLLTSKMFSNPFPLFADGFD